MSFRVRISPQHADVSSFSFSSVNCYLSHVNRVDNVILLASCTTEMINEHAVYHKMLLLLIDANKTTSSPEIGCLPNFNRQILQTHQFTIRKERIML